VLVLGLVYSTQSVQRGNVEFGQVRVCCYKYPWLCLKTLCAAHLDCILEHHRHAYFCMGSETQINVLCLRNILNIKILAIEFCENFNVSENVFNI